MRRSQALQGAVVALMLFVGGGVALRLLHSSLAPERPPATVPPPAQPLHAASPQAPDTPAANLALQLAELLGELDRQSPAEAEGELAKSRQRDSIILADKLRDLMRSGPSEWRRVFDVLELEDPRYALKAAAMVREAVDEAGERDLTEILQRSNRVESRRLALAFLSGRRSSSSLDGMMAAVQQDGNSGVRFEALRELGLRQGPTNSIETNARIDQVIRERGLADPSPEVRNAALRMSGQAVSGDGSPPPRPLRAKLVPAGSIQGGLGK